MEPVTPDDALNISEDARQDMHDEAWGRDTSLKDEEADTTAPLAPSEEPQAPKTAPSVQQAANNNQRSNDTAPLALETLATSAKVSKHAPSAQTPGSDSRAGKSFRSFAAIWGAAQEKAQIPMRLIVVGVLAAGMLGTSIWAYCSFDLFQRAPALQPPSLETLLGTATPREDREAWLKDVLAAKRDASNAWDPVSSAESSMEASPPIPLPTTASVPQKRRAQRKVLATKASGALPQVPPADDFYGSIFGSAQRYETASSHPASRGSGIPEVVAQAPDVRGVVVQARLQDEVASEPSGAPVIATLRRKAQIGDVLLPAGTEVHGQTIGSSDTRVFVRFEFARTVGGEHIGLRGQARDEGGRTGIPGKRRLTHATVGSVGVASVSSGIAAAGRNLAGEVGDAFGAAIEAAGATSAEKARRVDRDEYVVVASQNTNFGIYIESLSFAHSS